MQPFHLFLEGRLPPGRVSELSRGQLLHTRVAAASRCRGWPNVLSDASPEQERDHCIAAGMDDYMMKPIDVKVLHALLRKYAPERITAHTAANVVN